MPGTRVWIVTASVQVQLGQFDHASLGDDASSSAALQFVDDNRSSLLGLVVLLQLQPVLDTYIDAHTHTQKNIGLNKPVVVYPLVLPSVLSHH